MLFREIRFDPFWNKNSGLPSNTGKPSNREAEDTRFDGITQLDYEELDLASDPTDWESLMSTGSLKGRKRASTGHVTRKMRETAEYDGNFRGALQRAKRR